MQFTKKVFHVKSNNSSLQEPYLLRFPEFTDLPSAFGTKDWVVVSLHGKQLHRFAKQPITGARLSSIFRKCLAWSFNSCGLQIEKFGLTGLTFFDINLLAFTDDPLHRVHPCQTWQLPGPARAQEECRPETSNIFDK